MPRVKVTLMKIKELEQFFEKLALKITTPVQIYLTGGIAALYWGGRRPTVDLDFALQADANWDEISKILIEQGEREGIPLEFTEDISRWGMVGFGDFKKGAKLFKQWGEFQVYFLDPIIWSVGKMNRYTGDDIADMVAVFKKQKIDAKKAIQIWSQAFLESPRSTELGLFKKKVLDFLSHSGPKIWGPSFDSKKSALKFCQLISRH